jgi:hypothetical protein
MTKWNHATPRIVFHQRDNAEFSKFLGLSVADAITSPSGNVSYRALFGISAFDLEIGE